MQDFNESSMGVLRECLGNSVAGTIFSAKDFFQQWFRTNGSAHFFLFHKNLSVTNLQVAELIALLRTHVTDAEGKRVVDLQFLSAEEFRSAVVSLAASYRPLDSGTLNLLSTLYCDLLRNIIVVDLFFGSCTVFTPPGIALDARAVCAYSGFLYSGGTSLLNRNIDKASKEELFNVITAFLDKRTDLKLPVQFIVYAEEEYTPHDRDRSSELRRGLDEVKVSLTKYYLGDEPLVSALKHLRERFQGRVLIPPPDHFEQLLRSENEGAVLTSAETIWLVVDRRPGADLRHRGDRQYFLCYFQEYRNESAVRIFEENKPAWVEHTTLPHSLAGAMINLTRPWWPAQTVTVGDPFVGTGTTLLETAKRRAKFIGVDSCPIVHQLLQDNETVFTMPAEGLRALAKRLKDAEEIAPAERLVGDQKFDATARHGEVRGDYFWGLRVFDDVYPRLHGPQADGVFPESALANIKSAQLGQRVYFYLALRTHHRHLSLLERDHQNWREAYIQESVRLRDQITSLAHLRARQERCTGESAGVLSFAGRYSLSCAVEPDLKRVGTDIDGGRIRVFQGDFKELPAAQCDIIVTDPPYGFNSPLDRRTLAELYADMLRVMLRGLKREGQLVLALPDWSHVGRQVPFFITSRFVTAQILAIAEQEGFEVIQGQGTTTLDRRVQPPYYWESDRALRRAILHFRFRRAIPSRGENSC